MLTFDAPRRLCCLAIRGVAALGIVTVMLGACAGNPGTIGARLGRDPEGHVVVRETPHNLGSAKAGLQPGDEVLLIEGQDVRELSEQMLHEALIGELGTRVRLTVQRGDQVLRVVVERTPAPRSRTLQ